MIKHQVVINVADTKDKQLNVLKGGDIKLRTRLLDFLFGKQHKMLVLVPSETVKSVSIKEVKENE